MATDEQRKRANERCRRWRQRNLEKSRAQSREYSRRHGKARNVRLLYGIPIEEYWRLERQATHCPICGIALDPMDTKGSKARKVLDHDHASGAVRGFVCQQCNIGLGAFNDDPDALEKAARWIRENAKPNPQRKLFDEPAA